MSSVRTIANSVRGHPSWQHLVARPFSRNLDLLARIYGTDKSSRAHGYTTFYERHLGPRRKEIKALLEIGVGGTTSAAGYATSRGGMSLRMWRDFFPSAQITGIDVHAKAVAGHRIGFEQGSQDDPAFLVEIAERHGPFDVIVDDGSHLGSHVRTSFDVLFDYVRSGGFYVIEDLAVAYDPDWEGGPPGTAGTQMELIRETVDDVHRNHWTSDQPARAISSIHLYDGIVFIEKS